MQSDPDEHSNPGQEVLEWDPRDKKAVQGLTPAASYNKFSENARKMISTENACAMFCRGKKCKYCTWIGWPDSKMAISGLYSSWITSKILAMARPTTKALHKRNVLNQFLTLGVKTVINLEVQGEHASCGDGNEPSGFSYNPQELMAKKIYFYNFAWPDFGVAPLSSILDTVKVMQFALSEGKVAVHCHAGLGRTGLLVACYLVYNNRMTAANAVHYVRHRRPGSIQSSVQVNCAHIFEEYLIPFRVIFSHITDRHEVSLREFLDKQQKLLHGFEGRKLKYIPKIMYVCCERLLELANRGTSLNATFESVSATSLVSSAITTKSSPLRQLSGPGKSDSLKQLLGESKPARCRSLEDLTDNQFKTVLSSKQGRVPSDDEDDDDCIIFGYPRGSPQSGVPSTSPLSIVSLQTTTSSDSSSSSQKSTSGQSEAKTTPRSSPRRVSAISTLRRGSFMSPKGELVMMTPARESSPSARRDSVRSRRHSVHCGGTSHLCRQCNPSLYDRLDKLALTVVDAMCVGSYSHSVEKKVKALEASLNKSDEAWNDLALEVNPLVVSALLWEWLDQLKEPVLSTQDLNAMLKTAEKPSRALQKVQKHIKHVIEYLAMIVVKLQPLPEYTERRLLEKLLSYLTHKIVKKDLLSAPMTHIDDWVEMKSKMAERLFVLFVSIMHDVSASV